MVCEAPKTDRQTTVNNLRTAIDAMVASRAAAQAHHDFGNKNHASQDLDRYVKLKLFVDYLLDKLSC